MSRIGDVIVCSICQGPTAPCLACERAGRFPYRCAREDCAGYREHYCVAGEALARACAREAAKMKKRTWSVRYRRSLRRHREAA